MGSFVSNLMGSESQPHSGGEGGVDDLKRGMQDQANELLVGLGPTREARQVQMQSFTQALSDQAMGKAPSLAEQALRGFQDRNLKLQVAAAKANRQVNPALASRQVQRLAGDQAQQTNQQAALMRLQERNAAQDKFANFQAQQQQLSAQSRAAALGGAQAAANINAANTARGDRMFGAMVGTISGAAAPFVGGGKPAGKYKGGLIESYSKGGKVQSKLAGPGRILDIANGEAYANPFEGTGSAVGGVLGNLLKPQAKDLVMAGGPMDEMGTGVQSPYDHLIGRSQVLPASQGAMVPGVPIVNGDSPKNDFVPALLSPGEIVVPRTVVADGPKAIKGFAEALLAKKAGPKKVQKYNKGGIIGGYAAVLAARTELNERKKSIDSKFGKRK